MRLCVELELEVPADVLDGFRAAEEAGTCCAGSPPPLL